MGGEDTLLQRAFPRSEAIAVLDALARMAPGAGIALLDPDRRPIARAGEWPDDSFASMLAATATRPLPPENGRALRFHPVCVATREVGTLVVRGDEDARSGTAEALHAWLSLLLGKIREVRELPHRRGSSQWAHSL